LPLSWFRRRIAGGERARERTAADQPVEVTPEPAVQAEPETTAADSTETADPTARPKRRRGTRGGRGRKRKPAAGADGAEGAAATATVEEAAGAAPEPSNESEDKWEYTPMSEWGSLDADEE